MEKEIKVKNQEFVAQATFLEKIFLYLSMILIIPIFWYIIKKNHLNQTKEKIEEAASNIDIQLKKRRDLLIKLIDTTKSYIKFEKEILENITNIRMSNSNNMKEIEEKNKILDQTQKAINVQIENYPDLKTIIAVKQLQKAEKDCEDNISAARRFYNHEVLVYNQYLRTFPSNVVASNLKLKNALYFEATAEDVKDVKIDFN